MSDGSRTFSGQGAVITGAGSGLGEALVRALAEAGAAVVVADIEEAAAERVAADLREAGRRALAIGCDVSDRVDVERLVKAAQDFLGEVNVLCNNAGVFHQADPPEATEADWRWLLDVNVLGVVHGIQAFLPGMRSNSGLRHIVNTSSFGGLAAGLHGGIAAYAASKYAVVGLSEQLRFDLAPEGIGVTVICPGGMPTRIHESERLRPGGPAPADAAEDPALMARFSSGTPTSLVAQATLDAVLADRPYVMSATGFEAPLERRFEALRASFEHAADPRRS